MDYFCGWSGVQTLFQVLIIQTNDLYFQSFALFFLYHVEPFGRESNNIKRTQGLQTYAPIEPEHTIYLIWLCPVVQLKWTKLQQILKTVLTYVEAAPVVLNQNMAAFHVAGSFVGNSFNQHKQQQMLSTKFMVTKHIIQKHRFSKVKRLTPKLTIIHLVICMPMVSLAERLLKNIFSTNASRSGLQNPQECNSELTKLINLAKYCYHNN